MTDLRVCHLYPEHLNIYADRGNIAVLRYRCERCGYRVRGDRVRAGRSASRGRPRRPRRWPDRDQVAIAGDLVGKAGDLRSAVTRGAAGAGLFGGYQLLGPASVMRSTNWSTSSPMRPR